MDTDELNRSLGHRSRANRSLPIRAEAEEEATVCTATVTNEQRRTTTTGITRYNINNVVTSTRNNTRYTNET
jgi:hypothetical protein